MAKPPDIKAQLAACVEQNVALNDQLAACNTQNTTCATQVTAQAAQIADLKAQIIALTPPPAPTGPTAPTAPTAPIPPASLPPTTTPIIDAVSNTGLATGRGGPAVIWIDDNDDTKVLINAGQTGYWSNQFNLPKLGLHHISGYDATTGGGIQGSGIPFVTTAFPPAPALPPRYGFAQKYISDKGIGGDPAVLRIFDPTAAVPWATWTNPAAFTTTPDPVTGLARVHMRYNPGDFSPCTANWMFSQNGRVGPDKMYMRYYWTPAADFQCTVDGKKLPGPAGRYGPYGNGGNATTGRRESDGLSGWSARTLAIAGASAGDPIVLATYLYWADMGAGYGHDFVWNCAPIYPGQTVCIEIYVEMNTVLGPFDTLGNGAGQPDGILQTWVNGVPAFSKMDLRYRHNLDIHIDEIWLNHYHGGGIPAETTHTFWMGGIVAANQYIGPVQLPLPTTTAVTTINKNVMSSVPVTQLGTIGMRDAFQCWSGGIWVPDAQAYVHVAGGEGCPGPAMTFDKPTGLWRVGSAVSTQVHNDWQTDTTFDKTWFQFADNVGAIGHTYDTVAWVPASWGFTSAKGGVILPVRDVVYKTGSCYRAMLFDVGTGVWKKASNDVWQATQSNTGGGNSVVLDALKRRYYMISGATSRLQNDRIATLTFTDASGIGIQGRGPQFAATFVPRYPVQVLVDRRVVIAGAGEDYTLQLQWYDADKLDAINPITWQGDSIYSCAGLGLAWCPWAGCFMALPCTSPDFWPAQDQNAQVTKPVVELFKIVPNWGGTWTVTRVPITGAIGYTPTFTGKRLFADPVYQTINWAAGYDGPVYSLRVTA